MKIKKAKLGDAKEILRLLNSEAVLTGDDDLHYLPKHIKEHIIGKSFITFIQQENNKVIGLISINLFPIGKYAELYNIVIDKNYREKKIGLRLTLFAEEYLKKKGYEIIYLYTEKSNISAQKLAEKVNYKRGKTLYFYSKKLNLSKNKK
jgi:ribosomal protein S18 acetylase RimI-like enzyme